MLRCISFVACAAVSLGAIGLVEAQSAAPYTTGIGGPKPGNPNKASMQMPMTMPLVAPFFIEDGDYHSTITMVNELTKMVHGTVTARAQDGSELATRVIAFAPHSQTVLAVSDLLNLTAGPAVGSIEIDPNPTEAMGMAIAAQLSIVNGHTTPETYLEEEFIMADPGTPSQYRAAVPGSQGSPVVALLNTAMVEQNVTVRCLQEDGSVASAPVHLAAQQMRMVRVCEGNASPDVPDNGFEAALQPTTQSPSAVAIEAGTDGPSGSLAVWGAAGIGRERRTPIALNFANAPSLRTSKTVFAGVPVGTADLLPGDTFTPNLAVANFGTKPAKVSVSYSSTAADGTHAETIATLVLPGSSVQHVELPKLNGDPLLRNSFSVSSDAKPGAVISNLILRGQEQYPVIQLIGKDPGVANGGGHPWTIANDNRSTALLFNSSEKEQLFNVNIVANGVKWHQEYHLQPSETRAISVNDLINNQVKDLRGKTLPAAAMTGEISWFTIDPDNSAGRVLVSNTQSGLARNFSCGYNLVLCGISMYNPSVVFSLAELGDLGPLSSEICTAYDPNACSGGQYSSGDGGAYSWWSNSTSIAPLSGSGSNASASFYGSGSGVGSATGEMSSASCAFQDQGTNTVTPQVLLNGTVISQQSPGSIVIGQKATLSVNTGSTGLSSAGWTVGGTTVATWNPGPAPPAANFSQTSPTFYWVPTYYYTSRMPTSWSVAVSVKATLSNGQTVNAAANVTVKAPSVSVTPYTSNSITLYNTGSMVGAACGDGGLSTICMQLTPQIAPPSGVSGNYEWVQVEDSSGYTYMATNGSQHSCNISQPLPGLDNSNPYPNSTNEIFQDSPLLAPPPTGKQTIAVSKSFSAVLMWQPTTANSIWVPLSSTNWNWNGTVALSNGSWVLTGATAPNSPPNNPQVLYGGYWPVWSSTVINNKTNYTCN